MIRVPFGTGMVSFSPAALLVVIVVSSSLNFGILITCEGSKQLAIVAIGSEDLPSHTEGNIRKVSLKMLEG